MVGCVVRCMCALPTLTPVPCVYRNCTAYWPRPRPRAMNTHTHTQSMSKSGMHTHTTDKHIGSHQKTEKGKLQTLYTASTVIRTCVVVRVDRVTVAPTSHVE